MAFSRHVKDEPAFKVEGGNLTNWVDLSFKKRHIAKFMFEYFRDAFAHFHIQGHTVNEGNMGRALGKYVSIRFNNLEHNGRLEI